MNLLKTSKKEKYCGKLRNEKDQDQGLEATMRQE